MPRSLNQRASQIKVVAKGNLTSEEFKELSMLLDKGLNPKVKVETNTDTDKGNIPTGTKDVIKDKSKQ